MQLTRSNTISVEVIEQALRDYLKARLVPDDSIDEEIALFRRYLVKALIRRRFE